MIKNTEKDVTRALSLEEASRDIEEIKEILNCDADAEIKLKMIYNTIYSPPHYFKLSKQPSDDAADRLKRL